MAEERTARKLAAIVAADMAGYSRLVEVHEQETLARQKAHLREVIAPRVGEFSGRIFKTTGDGFMAEFSSVVDSVQCAIAVQRDLVRREESVPERRRLRYRIGVNLGEVVADGEDVFGDGVNVAARLEAIAEPGGICISSKVHSELVGKLDVEFEDLGELNLKNISRPVRAYRIIVEPGPRASGDLAMLDVVFAKPAVAVLPFANLGGDPAQDYFGDGLAEDIITLLSAWRSFPVIARNSSFAYKGRAVDVRRIGQELKARYVIEGSVRRSGNRARVTAQLSDAETGHHLWADKFEGDLGDIFAIQDEITQRIVAVVQPELEQAEFKRAAARRAANPDAWDLLLRARTEFNRYTPEGNAAARALFEKAIAADPQFADAYAGLSLCHQHEILFETTPDRAHTEREGLRFARRAVELDDSSSVAHLSLSGAFIWSNQHEASIAETRVAMQLNPSNVFACLALGNRLDITGNPGEGIPLMEKSLRLNPRDPRNPIYFVQLGRAYINQRKYELALIQLREAIRRRPDLPHAYHVMAICLGHLGRAAEARDAAAACERIRPGFMAKRVHWNIYVDPEANRHLTDGLRKAGLA